MIYKLARHSEIEHTIHQMPATRLVKPPSYSILTNRSQNLNAYIQNSLQFTSSVVESDNLKANIGEPQLIDTI